MFLALVKNGSSCRNLSKDHELPKFWCIDTTRAFEKFGFRAETVFNEGLRRTVEWYRENTGL